MRINSPLHFLPFSGLVFFLTIYLCPPAVHAQGVAGRGGEPLPGVPQDCILDEAGFFRDHPEKREEMSQSLRAVREKHGYPVYVAIFYNVFEGSLLGKAEELRSAWLGAEGQGMVIVYQRDPVTAGRNPEVAYYRGSELDIVGGGVEQQGNVIPERDAAVLLAKAREGAKATPGQGVDYLCGLVSGLERELGEYFRAEPPRWNDSSRLKAMLLFAGTIAGLGLLGMLLWKLSGRSGKESGRQYVFPDVKTGRRLGAPFGGGWTSERTFVPASSRK